MKKIIIADATLRMAQQSQTALSFKEKIEIAKITNKENGMCYIGQSVNLADRLRAHIKAGLGIDSSNNKLYTAMK